MSDATPNAGAGKVNTESILDAARTANRKGPPPVHLWNPPFCGDLDIRIARDGTWSYLGSAIRRPELVRLFASILRKEGDDYFLVTPVEKVGIKVEDVPFIAIDFDRNGDDLVFETNVGDRVRADPEHTIRVETDPATGEPSPYLHVRRGLEALIDRKSFYRLAELSVEVATGEGQCMVVHSGGERFVIGPAA